MPISARSHSYSLWGDYNVEEANGSFYKSTDRNGDVVLFPENEYHIIKYPGKVYKFTLVNSNKSRYVAYDDLQRIDGDLQTINLQNPTELLKFIAKDAEEAKKKKEYNKITEEQEEQDRKMKEDAFMAAARARAANLTARAKPWWKAWGGGRKTRRTCRTKGKTRRSKA